MIFELAFKSACDTFTCGIVANMEVDSLSFLFNAGLSKCCIEASGFRAAAAYICARFSCGV